MGYKIAYASFEKEKKQTNDVGWRNRILAVLLVTVLVAAAVTVKRKSLPWLSAYLLPGDPAVTAAALEDMVTDLREGDSLYDAVTAFCREIVEHGEKNSD